MKIAVVNWGLQDWLASVASLWQRYGVDGRRADKEGSNWRI